MAYSKEKIVKKSDKKYEVNINTRNLKRYRKRILSQDDIEWLKRNQ
jgi:hypothetical protein